MLNLHVINVIPAELRYFDPVVPASNGNTLTVIFKLHLFLKKKKLKQHLYTKTQDEILLKVSKTTSAFYTSQILLLVEC